MIPDATEMNASDCWSEITDTEQVAIVIYVVTLSSLDDILRHTEKLHKSIACQKNL